MQADRNNKIRVLLADDHQVVRTGIRQILERAGDIEVIAEADNGERAKELIAERQPDIAVLDIQMPLASGIEVTRWIRVKAGKVAVLILTAYNDDPYVLAVLQAGANGYVLKTASPEELIQAVYDVYEGKSVLDPSLTQKLIAHLSNKQNILPGEALTDRELTVLILTARGYTNKAIGAQLGISDRTVQGHLAHIFDKLQASSRTEAVTRALTFGWITSESIGTTFDN